MKLKIFLTLLIFILVPVVLAISYYDTLSINDYQSLCIMTHNISGDLKNADGAPSYNVTEDNAFATSISAGTLTAQSLGRYCNRWQITAAAGYEADKLYHIEVQAVVGGVRGGATGGFYVTSDGNSIEEINNNIRTGQQSNTTNITNTITYATSLLETTTNANAQYQNTTSNCSKNEATMFTNIAALPTVANTNLQYQNTSSNVSRGQTWLSSILETTSNANAQYQNITGNASNNITNINKLLINLSTGLSLLQPISSANSQYTNITGNCSKDVATLLTSTANAQTTSNANLQYQNMSSNISNSAVWLSSVLSKITVGDVMNAILQNSSKSLNTTLGETWSAALAASCDLAGVEEGLQTNASTVTAGCAVNASNVMKNITDTVSGGNCDLTSVNAGIQNNRTALEQYIHSKYSNITSNCSSQDAAILNYISSIPNLQTILNANSQYTNITGNCSKDVATLMSYVDVLPATAPVSWNDVIDVDTLLTTLQTNMNTNTSLIVTSVNNLNTTIILNVSTSESKIINDMGLVLLGIASNSSNISSGISSVLRDVALAQTITNANSQYQNITNNVSQGITYIVTTGNSAWTTATGFATSTQASDILKGVLSNASVILVGMGNNATNIMKNVTDTVGATDLSSLQTISNANAQYQNVTSNISQGVTYIVNTGNSGWITATGFATTTQASDLLKGVQSNGTVIILGISNNASNVMKNVTDTIDVSTLQTSSNANLQYKNITQNASSQDATIINLINTLQSTTNLEYQNITLNTSQGQTYIISMIPSTTAIDNVIEDEAIITNLGTNFTGLFGNQTNLKQVVDDIKNGMEDNTSLIINVVSQNITATILNISKGQTNLQNNISDGISGVQAQIQHATYGLSALKTLIDAIQTSINNLVGNFFNAVLRTGKSMNVTLSDIHSGTNKSTAANISAITVADIANQTFRKEIQSVTTVYYNNSLGYPLNETTTYNDGTIKIIHYNYSSDNVSIVAKTEYLTN